MFGPALYEAFRDDQADLRSARHLQPRQDRRRAAAHRQPALRRRLPDADSGDATSTSATTAAWAAPSRCAAASARAARRSTARCARRTWRRATRRTRRAAAPTCCAWRWPASSARPASATTACTRSLDLCLECRACKAECPVGVDVARFKSEFLADYWQRHGTPLPARALGHVRRAVALGQPPRAAVERAGAGSAPVALAERDAARHRSRGGCRRVWTRAHAVAQRVAGRPGAGRPRRRPRCSSTTPSPNYYDPEIGLAALDVLDARRASARGWRRTAAAAVRSSRRACSTRRGARAGANTRARCTPRRQPARPIVFFEPSCLSALREDVPALLRGAARERAHTVARACVLFEEFLEQRAGGGTGVAAADAGPARILLHGHCHQKSMGLVAPARGAAVAHPGRARSSTSTPAAAAWPARSATRASTTTCRGRSASVSCCRPRARWRPMPCSSPPARRAAIRSHDFTGAPTPCIRRCCCASLAGGPFMSLAWPLAALALAIAVTVVARHQG